MPNHVLDNKKVNIKKLLNFGFVKKDNVYVYSAYLSEGLFKLTVALSNESLLNTELIEVETNETYTLHLVPNANGAFVGKIKTEYENIIDSIVENCFDNDVFKNDFSKKVIEYAREKYGDELEFLWEKFSKNAILRRKDSNKWYAALLIIPENKIGLSGTKKIEILDLRAEPEEITLIVDRVKYFPGYHMNKKHWITIVLDGSVTEKELYQKIDESYRLAKK